MKASHFGTSLWLSFENLHIVPRVLVRSVGKSVKERKKIKTP